MARGTEAAKNGIDVKYQCRFYFKQKDAVNPKNVYFLRAPCLTKEMAKKTKEKVTSVRTHPMKVPPSRKNPKGSVTTRHQHPRRVHGTYLDREEIENIFKGYDRKNVLFPTKGKLKTKNSDNCDEIIAVWTDYFNKKFKVEPPLDPDVVKALIASESDFVEDPPGNAKATGIAQITPETLKVLQDSQGEVKDFVFSEIRKKDLKNPNIAIPMAIRWLIRKKRLADGKLGGSANAEEIILEYKGLLKSKTTYRDNALKKFREVYGILKEK